MFFQKERDNIILTLDKCEHRATRTLFMPLNPSKKKLYEMVLCVTPHADHASCSSS